MSTQELFNRIMSYQKFDRIPTIVFENFEVSTLERWRYEGLPPDQSPIEYLDMDKITHLPVSFLPIPGYDDGILAENEESFVQIDFMGATVKRLKSNPSMYYGYIDYPVKSRDDWKRYKERFNASSSGRLPEYLTATPRNLFEHSPLLVDSRSIVDKADLIKLNQSGDLLMLHFFPFFFRLGFYSMGMERFMMAFYDMPDLIHEMFDFWIKFTIETIKPLMGHVRIDIAAFTEDFAYKTGPHLSPEIYKEFFIPYQNILVSELKKYDINVIGVWTAGNADAYLPILLENGVNCFLILEQQAGMDPIKLREKYGKELLLIGGIAKEALISGPIALDKEIDRLMPLIRQGGYIPAIDDMIPPEVPFSHYVHYVKRLKEIKI